MVFCLHMSGQGSKTQVLELNRTVLRTRYDLICSRILFHYVAVSSSNRSLFPYILGPSYLLREQTEDGHAESRIVLLNDLTDDTGTDSSAALTDIESQPLLHGDRRDKLNVKSSIVARHNHLCSLLQLQVTSDISGTEEELRSVVGEEGCVAATLILVQAIHLGLELGCCVNCSGLGKDLF